MRFISFVVLVWMLILAPAVSFAANEGQEDLDKAIDLQLNVQSLADLEKVASLAESALDKGLEKESADFARQLLAATLFQHAKRLSAAIFEQTPPSPRWPGRSWPPTWCTSPRWRCGSR